MHTTAGRGSVVPFIYLFLHERTPACISCKPVTRTVLLSLSLCLDTQVNVGGLMDVKKAEIAYSSTLFGNDNSFYYNVGFSHHDF